MQQSSPDCQIISSSPRSFSPARLNSHVQRERVKQIIARNQGFASIAFLREQLLTQLSRLYGKTFPSPVTLHLRKRNAHLRPFLPFFRRVLDPHSASPRMRSFVRNVQVAARFGWKAREFRQIPSIFDQRFSDPDDLIEPLFAIIFQDRDADLLRQWMRTLDNHVEAVSRRFLEIMDRRARAQQAPLRADVVLVGGGPLTSLAASVLGAFFHVTVITEQHGLGKPWRHRPIYINSSSRVEDFNGAPLPLLGGCTTRIIGRQQLNSLEVDLLLGTESKRVLCDNGETTEYIAGPRLGDLVATNLLLHADDYLINQRVDVSRIQRTTDGAVRLTLIDTEEGTRRELDASAVFLLTGPGKERSAVPGSNSQKLYDEAAGQLDVLLSQARQQVRWYREALRQLEKEPSTPGVQTQQQWVRQHIAQQIAQIRTALPRVLTLTALEHLYEFWQECGADPASFPLTDLIVHPQTIAYVGNGDTMRTLKELVEGQGPQSAYPAGMIPAGATGAARGKSAIYNEPATSAQEYDATNRRRYQGLYTPTTTALPFKARGYRLLNLNGKARVEVSHQDEQGRRCRRRYGYVFDCTGLDRRPLEAAFPAALPVQDIRDLQGVVVARGNAEANVFIGGAATGWSARDFPAQAQRIVSALGIAENTISLWINAPLVERLAYTYAATRLQSRSDTRGRGWHHSGKWLDAASVGPLEGKV